MPKKARRSRWQIKPLWVGLITLAVLSLLIIWAYRVTEARQVDDRYATPFANKIQENNSNSDDDSESGPKFPIPKREGKHYKTY